MFDLEIMIPVDLSISKITKRFEDLKKYGILNHSNFKIKIWFIASNDTTPESLKLLEKGFSKNFNISSVISPYKHVAQRIMYYYTEIMKADTAKWYIRMDEDSITDIQGMMENLEKDFDYTRDYYIVGEINRDISDIECKILLSLGFDSWYKIQGHDLKDAPAHEYEISITSNSAVKRILQNETCLKYLKIRKEFAEGFGDHAFCLAARMVKIYPISVRFLTYHPRPVQLSIFGGFLNHTHHIARDFNGEFLDWLDLTENGKNEELEKKLMDEKNIYFLEWFGSREKLWISFNKNKRLEKNSSKLEVFGKECIGLWGITKEGKLTVFVDSSRDNNPLIILEQKEDAFYSTGKKFQIETKNSENPFKKVLM